MTLLDWIIVATLVLFTWNGYRVGLVQQLFQLIGIGASYYVARTCAPILSPVLSAYVLQHSSISAPHSTGIDLFNQPMDSGLSSAAAGSLAYGISFSLLFLATYVVMRVVGALVSGIAELPVLSLVNHVAGAAIGLILVVLFGSIALHIAMVLPLPAAHAAISRSALAAHLMSIQLWPNGQLPQPVPPKQGFI